MSEEEVVKGKNLFDEEKIIDAGMKEPLFISIPFDEYKKYRKLQEENEKLKHEHLEADVLIEALRENDLSYLEELAKAWEKNEELQKEVDDLIKENHKHIDYIASMKKKHEDKIRDKIKELEGTISFDLTIEVLKELLGDDE